MVQAHLMRQGIEYQRPTEDVDMIVEFEAVSIGGVVADLRGLGYEPHEPIDENAPFHRVSRSGTYGRNENVDVMGPRHRQAPEAPWARGSGSSGWSLGAGGHGAVAC